MSRRTTLGPVSQSSLNARGGSSRASIGPSRISNGNNNMIDNVKQSRQSIAGGMISTMSATVVSNTAGPSSSRQSMGMPGMVPLAMGAARRSSIGTTR